MYYQKKLIIYEVLFAKSSKELEKYFLTFLEGLDKIISIEEEDHHIGEKSIFMGVLIPKRYKKMLKQSIKHNEEYDVVEIKIAGDEQKAFTQYFTSFYEKCVCAKTS